MLERLKSTITVAKNHSEEVLRNMAYSSALMGAVFLGGENKSAIADEVVEGAFTDETYSESDTPESPESEKKAYSSPKEALQDGDIETAYKLYRYTLNQFDTALKLNLKPEDYAQARIYRGRTFAELAKLLKEEKYCNDALSIVHRLQLCDGDHETAAHTLLQKYEGELVRTFHDLMTLIGVIEKDILESEEELNSIRKSPDFLTSQELKEKEQTLIKLQNSRYFQIHNAVVNLGQVACETGNARLLRKPLEECSPDEAAYAADLYRFGIDKSSIVPAVKYMSHVGLGKVELHQGEYQEAAQNFMTAGTIQVFTKESFDGFLSSVKELSAQERSPLFHKAFNQLEKDGTQIIASHHAGKTPYTIAEDQLDTLQKKIEALLSLLDTEEEAALHIEGMKLFEQFEQSKKNIETVHMALTPTVPKTSPESVAVDAEMP